MSPLTRKPNRFVPCPRPHEIVVNNLGRGEAIDEEKCAITRRRSKRMAMLLAALAAALGQTTSLTAGVLDVIVDTSGGTYSVLVEGTAWFSSGDAFFSDGGKILSLFERNISVLSSKQDVDEDSAGTFQRVSLDWGSHRRRRCRVAHKLYRLRAPELHRLPAGVSQVARGPWRLSVSESSCYAGCTGQAGHPGIHGLKLWLHGGGTWELSRCAGRRG